MAGGGRGALPGGSVGSGQGQARGTAGGGHKVLLEAGVGRGCDGYYVAYKPITPSCIFFMFIEMKFIHCHSCVIFAMKSMSMCND